jgi:hypothetical protein
MTQRDEYISSIVQNLGRLSEYDLNKINANIIETLKGEEYKPKNPFALKEFIVSMEYSPVRMISVFHTRDIYPYSISTAKGTGWIFCKGLSQEPPSETHHGNKIEAIRQLREITKCGLADGKFAIELIMRDGWEAFIKYYTEV